MGDKLTRRTLDAWIKSGENEGWLWCGEQRGFGAQRRGNGTAAFVVQFRVGRGRLAKRRRVVLGEYPAMTPEQAREQAVTHISAGWRGDDLVAEKRTQQAAQARQKITVKDQAEAFHAARRAHLNCRSAHQYQSLWRRLIIPNLGSKPVSELKRREVANLMDGQQ